MSLSNSVCPSNRLRSKEEITKQVMELPRNMDGDIDWNTLGNILVAHDLGEVHCASYVDPVFGKEDPGFQAETDWKFSYQEKGVVVLRKQIEGSPIFCYMGRSVIDVPVKAVHDFLTIYENAVHFDKYALESKLLKELRNEADKKDVILYKSHQSRVCLVRAKRDFVFYSRWEVLNDGKRVMSSTSVDLPDYPVLPGFIRGQLLPGTGWVLEPYHDDPSKTLISQIVHVDLVTLPPLITNRVMRRVPLGIHYIQEYFSKNPTNTSPEPSPHPSTLTLPELPMSPKIPTPHQEQSDFFAELNSSIPMDSNPLYQSTQFLTSTRLRTQTQESWRMRGSTNERLAVTEGFSKIPTVREEGLGGETDYGSGFPGPFEISVCKDETVGKLQTDVEDSQWLIVDKPIERMSIRSSVNTPRFSNQMEWTASNSRNE